MLVFTHLVLYFAVYSLLGWLWEFLLNIVVYRRLRWHGFLTLPLMPIYGYSALAILLVVQPYVHNPFLVFITGAFVVTVIEYVTSLGLEKLFHVRLWDYSDWPFNLHGRIGLFSSMMFGMFGLFLLYVLHPFVVSLVAALQPNVVFVAAWIIFSLTLLDFINSVSSLVRISLDAKAFAVSLDDIQNRLDGIVDELRRHRRRLRLVVSRWDRFNLRHLRNAFPGARTTPKK